MKGEGQQGREGAGRRSLWRTDQQPRPQNASPEEQKETSRVGFMPEKAITEAEIQQNSHSTARL